MLVLMLMLMLVLVLVNAVSWVTSAIVFGRQL